MNENKGGEKLTPHPLSQWAYRIPFALQWVWPIILLIGLPFAPESPWWLIRQNKLSAAQNSLERLCQKTDSRINTRETLAMMIKTDILEHEIEIGTTYADCWKGDNRRRMEICILLFVIQNFSGNPVGIATYLFEQIGLSSLHAFDMGVGLNGMGFVGTLCSAIPLIYFGRRSCYIFGLSSVVTILYIVAFMSLAKDYHQNQNYAWAQATLLIVLQFIWQMTLGPLTYGSYSSFIFPPSLPFFFLSFYTTISRVGQKLSSHRLPFQKKPKKDQN